VPGFVRAPDGLSLGAARANDTCAPTPAGTRPVALYVLKHRIEVRRPVVVKQIRYALVDSTNLCGLDIGYLPKRHGARRPRVAGVAHIFVCWPHKAREGLGPEPREQSLRTEFGPPAARPLGSWTS
jgi:hypothetical protein